MIDLSELLDGPVFDSDPAAPTRVAFAHHSMRRAAQENGWTRQLFYSHLPGLGLLRVAQALREDPLASQAGALELRYFDEEDYASLSNMAQAIQDWLAPARRQVVAVSAFTATIQRLERFLRCFDHTRVLLVAGGPHATATGEVTNAHLVVRGAGSKAMQHIARAFPTDAFGTGSDADGLRFSRAGKTIQRPRLTQDCDLESPAPLFAYDLLGSDSTYRARYTTTFMRRLGSQPLIYVSTQGCRGRCSFCSSRLIHPRRAARPSMLIADDLRGARRIHQYDSIELHDDDLLQHPEFDNVLAALAAQQLPWFCYCRADNVTAGTARRMYEAGCRRVFLGIEALNAAKLAYFRKATTVEQNIAAAEALADAGIGVISGFIIGAPADTAASILEELHAFLQLPLLALSCTVLTADPGTRIWSELRGKDRSTQGTAATHPTSPPRPHAVSPSLCRHLSCAQLESLRTLVEARFYLRDSVHQPLASSLDGQGQSELRAFRQFLQEELDAGAAGEAARREYAVRGCDALALEGAVA